MVTTIGGGGEGDGVVDQRNVRYASAYSYYLSIVISFIE